MIHYTEPRMPIHYTDRSRFEVGSLCMRKLYWNYYYGGLGVVPVGERGDLTFGKAVHAVLEGPKADPESYLKELDEFVDVTPDGYPRSMEWRSLFYGLEEIYHRFVEPAILDEYEWVSSEQEMELDLGDGIHWLTRLDGVIRRKSDDTFFVLEAKTSSYMKELMNKSTTNFQLLMEVEAMRRSLPKGTKIGGAKLLVFDKGDKRTASKKEKEEGRDGYRRWSPFTYWYHRKHSNGDSEYSLSYLAHADKIAVWEIPDWYDFAVKEWPDVVRAQVQFWPSVDFDPDMTEHVIKQVLGRENRLVTFKLLAEGYPIHIENWKDQFFPQNFDKCKDTFRRDCEYCDACFSPRVNRDPVGSGLYQVREPNHPLELEGK